MMLYAQRSAEVIIPIGDAGCTSNSGSDFGDRDERHHFIMKVLMILLVQLLITFGSVVAFSLVEECKLWLKANPGVLMVATVLFLTMYFILLCPCCTPIMEAPPLNWIVLFLFTASMAFLTGVATSMYDVKGVFQALLATIVIVAILTVFAIQTTCDFTSCGAMICMMSIMLFVFGALFISFAVGQEQKEKAQLIYTSLAAILFCVYIIYDVQLIVGGNHPRSAELNSDMYILGAVLLYLDIVNLFLALVRLIADENND